MYNSDGYKLGLFDILGLGISQAKSAHFQKASELKVCNLDQNESKTTKPLKFKS
jgi:hypothetical protein